MYKQRDRKNNTGWNREAKKYNELVGDRGHYYHEHVVIPNLKSIINLKEGDSILDLGCGQGVFGKSLPQGVKYLGVDSAKNLIDIATKTDKNASHEYMVASATRPLKNIPESFSHAIFILSLQNMEYAESALKNAYDHLKPGGHVYLILNHPAFRIPRQSGWGEHPNKIQYRYVNIYMGKLSIPINMHPGQKNSNITISYHHPISFYINALSKLGFVVTKMEEWTSDKISTGKASKMENRSRSEIPMFMAIVAKKS